MVLRADRWEQHFALDQDFDFLISGVTQGFTFDIQEYTGTTPYQVPNYVPDEHVGKVTTAVEREIELGRTIRSSLSRVSGTAAIGVVDKQRSGFVKHRIIHDLSRPEGVSTNDRSSFDSRVFPTVRNAMDLLRPGQFMSKVDVSEFYRNFPSAFVHWKDLSFRWKIHGLDEETILSETRLPFGLSSAPGITDRFTSAIVRLMRSKGYTVIGYLDDFLLIGNSYEECLEAHEFLIWLLGDLGLPVSLDKCELPRRTIVFLGVELSTEAPGGICTAGVDEARVAHVLDSIKSLLCSKTVSARKVEAVLGLLTFVSQVIWGSRMFLRSAYQTLKVVNRKGSRRFVSLSEGTRRDLKWWDRIIRAQSTRRMIIGLVFPVSNFLWTTDASTSWGMGAFYQGTWFALSWVELRSMQQKPIYPFRCVGSSHINYLELFAVYWSLKTWGAQMSGLCLPIFTDSIVVRGMLRKLTGQPVFIPLLKEIWLMLLRFGIRLRPFYINTLDNILADCLSRGPSAEGQFRKALDAWRSSDYVSSDKDDWQLLPNLVRGLDRKKGVGPFVRDATSDVTGYNSHFENFWSMEDSCMDHDWAGQTIFCNPPFSLMWRILIHFIICKLKNPLGTSATFILPAWLSHIAIQLVCDMPDWFIRTQTFVKGSEIFTSHRPAAWGGGRRECGPTQWDVWVVTVPPCHLSIDTVPDWVLPYLGF